MSKSKKAHSEKRWCIKYVRKSDGKEYFGGMMANYKRHLPGMISPLYTAKIVRVLVTEIKPKRKAKR